MSDQEGSLAALTEGAIGLLGAHGDPVTAVPELSPVGESQSNGKSERAVQDLEDQLRTMKLAFEDRFKLRLGSSSAIMKWLVEHAANTINRCALGPDGKTPYQRLHGHPYNGCSIEFGEKNFTTLFSNGHASNWTSAGMKQSTSGLR